jgi:glycine cleavage system H protein
MMGNPKELLYAKTHEWVEMLDETTAKIGLTDFAQHALGDIVFVNLPEVGDAVTVGAILADVESVKAVSDIYSPVSGIVKEINEELLDNPGLINADPYGAWFFIIEAVLEKEELLGAGEYEAFCEEEE